MHSFNAVYARMLFAARVRTQTELAQLLEIRQGSISDAKRRGNIPMNWCVRLYDVCAVNVDWQRTGEGPIYDERKLEKMNDPGAQIAEEVFPGLPFVLRESDGPLELSWPGELPILSVVGLKDGTFPRVDGYVCPDELYRKDVVMFRVFGPAMAPGLNKGALVAVDRSLVPEDGDVVALNIDRHIIFRRVFRAEGGYALKADSGEAGVGPVRFIPDEDWGDVYYGKSIWAFQPL